MSQKTISRRHFFGASAAGTMAGAVALADPGLAAAQAVGVKPADLPDLTIKEVKVYVTDLGDLRRLNGTETGEIVSVVTNSGIEGNYTLGNRGTTPNWLDWAKPNLVGKNVLDLLPTLTATSGLKATYGFDGNTRRGGGGFGAGRAGGGGGAGRRPGVGAGAGRQGAGAGAGRQGGGGGGFGNRNTGTWPNFYSAAADVCLWDILGKSVNRPIYKLLGGTKDRMIAYASSLHLENVEDYVPDVTKAKEEGYRGYKIHPGGGQMKNGPPIPTYIGHMEEIRQVRKAVGDNFVLAHDPVQRYNVYEALKVGRLLDELDYAWFEDPIRTTDIEGLVELNRALDLPLHVGEFLMSISDYAEYIHRGALDVCRLISDNVGGISGSMRVGMLADAFNLECTPHNWGNPYDLAVHFHLELALPNAFWFEMPHPSNLVDRPYIEKKFRIDKDGYVMAPTEPGLGYPLDRAALEKMTKRIDR
ncbi:MAG TPA: mandelate racemase/muconate lactonizing enzyme family protein [Bryobacteraceae bacterium]|nr:mandelate racemase/muconate lactonizing enzyme family protein [Bryobacteraceae bacterium]